MKAGNLECTTQPAGSSGHGGSLSSSFLSWSEPLLGSSASLKVLVGLTAYKKLGRKEDIVSVRNFLKFLLFTF